MTKKFISFDVFLLLILSLINITIFFYSDKLPDHFLILSHNNTEVSEFAYFLTSILSGISYWSGIWILPSFLLLLFLRIFINPLNSYSYRFIHFLCFLLSSLTAFYLFFPFFLGGGLLISLSSFTNTTVMIFVFIFSTVSFLYLTSQDFFSQFIKYTSSHVHNLVMFSKNSLSHFSLLSFTSFIKMLFLKRLKRRRFPINPVTTSTKEFINREDINNTISDQDSKIIQSATPATCRIDSFDTKRAPNSSKKPMSHQPLHDTSNVSKKEPFFQKDDLINCITPKSNTHKSSELEDSYFSSIATSIEDKLKEFNISAQVINVLKGPVVDTFELELGPGVKVSGVTNRTDDLSLALMGAPIRMVYPMKGKSTIGIEVPRNPRDVIYLDEVLKSPFFNDSKFKLPIAMGKDAYGDPAVIDLASTPHLLVAGTTGAGKSVFVNTLLVSLIIKFSPKKLRLIMLDPKQLELALYQNLPHLIMPVVTDPSIASAALMWAIDEMERRYSLLKDFSVKNIEGFNEKFKNLNDEKFKKVKKYYPENDLENFELPYIVIVVDEFADLMLSKSGKAIETSISRLAAKARASGIHIVLATQRPSTDIITGVIKANFPTRVSFRVFTNIDSRVILDGVGAEKLLGKGDMLFKQGIDILRMHSAFVHEDEIESLVEKLSNLSLQFDSGAMEYLESHGMGQENQDNEVFSSDSSSQDEKYEEAIKCVSMHRVASASFLQRRLGVGYNRAANLIEELEANGIVGPAQGSKPRKVLIPPPAD